MEQIDIENLIEKRNQENLAKKEQEKKEQPTERKELSISHEKKSITELSMDDVKFKFDENKDYESQAETVVSAMSVVGAVQNEETRKELIEKKGEELKSKADAKAKEASAKATEAETEEQKAQRKLYEAVLENFGIYRHLPRWLMKIVVALLTPFYLLLVVIIGIPTGAVKFLVDCLDGIFVRYEKIERETKPRVKVITWVIVAVAVCVGICLTVLAILHKI